MAKDLLVVANQDDVVAIQRQIADDGMVRALKDSNERFFVVSPGYAHVGRRYANCVIARDLYNYLTAESPKDDKQARQVMWWQKETLHKIMDEVIVI